VTAVAALKLVQEQGVIIWTKRRGLRPRKKRKR